MILVLDNYDSFTYNLVQTAYNGEEIKVFRNDTLTPEEAELLNPRSLIISPGPGYPKDAGFSEDYIEYFKDKIPILGICLGHQAICETFGGKIIHAKEIMHGRKDKINLKQNEIFYNCPDEIDAGRYHSLVVSQDNFPECFEIIAETDDGEIMGVKHKNYPIWGLQFHPESIMTDKGELIIKNFLEVNK